MVRHTSETLLEIVDLKTDDWETGTVLIGNQPGGYKVSQIPCSQ